MFSSLMPLIQERPIDIRLEASPGDPAKIVIWVQPREKNGEKECAARLVPFTAVASPDDLEANLPGTLKQWLEKRGEITTSLADALTKAETETRAAADAAKKEAQDKLRASKKQVGTKPSAAPSSVKAPSSDLQAGASGNPGGLLDDDEEDEGGKNEKGDELIVPDPEVKKSGSDLFSEA